jgi:hypothetical protein
MHRVAATVCLAIAPVIAFAAIYKVQLPDGTILFTDSPPADGKILEERETKPTPRPTPAMPAVSPSSGATAPALPSPAPGIPPGSTVRPIPQTLDAANAEITAAERELAVVRRKLELGREPLPGERLGIVKGGTRLSPEYESRIAGLERDVAQAELRVKQAYEARNALR